MKKGFMVKGCVHTTLQKCSLVVKFKADSVDNMNN